VGAVLVGVDGDLVTGGGDLGGERGSPSDHRAQHEECRRPSPLGQSLEEGRGRPWVRTVVEGESQVIGSPHSVQPGEETTGRRDQSDGGGADVGHGEPCGYGADDEF
jgi:hypothetical protein